ncbi:sugar transferase [Paracoccus laeviglucosivorans]|uniref:Sugar transferase involved in LPS biosynthesis (Colanic, teichoic acid) n=1 Tax=Paracoccus laeviglucosivorans TaxID=1197861 RepID=A0A521F543_9RHOB|nr:sugar transferase [Paracoccus laeviglucosivorans]SMO91279.1 Sugar transferase involved in LPS biosynthesis (colanic, teichoic acid) [Paracoccus laeviglucosivorans]
MLSDAVKPIPETLERHAMGGQPRLSPAPIFQKNWYSTVGKRTLDVSGALTIGAIFLPIILIVAFFVRLQGKGMIFGHERIGRDGRKFRCLKFRTMVPDAEKRLNDLLDKDPEARREWEENRKLDKDPRITKLGHTLRRTSLDELPQLWNIIRGDMSLVGPRPVTAPELERYGDSVHAYHAVRPGLTGMWQVSGRNNVSYDERVRMDRNYAQAHSLPMDISILARTVMVVVGATGK